MLCEATLISLLSYLWCEILDA